MKLLNYILSFSLICGISACTELDLPPINVIQDKDVFDTENGIKTYLARVYDQMPIEDFAYSPKSGYNNNYIIGPLSASAGESLCREQRGARADDGYWENGYKELRNVNYFLETIPQYKSNFTQEQVNTWTGEMYLIRAITYYAMVRRYGGVPLVNEVLKYPDQPIEELHIPRASEEATYDQILDDLQKAYELLPEKNQKGRANRYAAAAFKARVALFAGSIAKYNEVSWFSDDAAHTRLCGITREKAKEYFDISYKATKLLEGHFSLYKNSWKEGDQKAQYQNYVDLFIDENSSENIFVRQYRYPERVHSYDCYNIPYQMAVVGWTSEVNPTLNFVEMFDGFQKNEKGQIDILNEDGTYREYNKITDLFANAEPRLKATVILPGETFKGEVIEIWRGVYVGDVSNGIQPFKLQHDVQKYEEILGNNLVSTIRPQEQKTVELNNGTLMNGSGRSGYFADDRGGALSGFSVRKLLNPNMPAANVRENYSDQDWIEMRYAEVLLTRAEAAYELVEEGVGGAEYLADAYNCINQIRERAGANLLSNQSELTKEVIRVERRKELGLENKVWWDLKRWRVAHKEMNNTLYRTLMPFYLKQNDKWIFDTRLDQNQFRYTYNSQWYYIQVPTGVISRSPIIKQNPGY